MKSIKNLVFISACAVAVIAVGCSSASYKKTPGGMAYKVFSGKDTQKVRVGDYVKFSLEIKVNDSTVNTTGKLPAYQQVPPTPQPYDLSEIWTKLKVGDSVVITQLMDTFMKRNPVNFPPQFKKGDRVMTYMKIHAVYTNDSIVRLDDEKAKKELLASEIKEVEKYVAGKNITAQKTESGSFVQIINPGTGNLIDSGKYVTVYYTGTTFAGVKFDSNTDTAFHHTEPLPFVAGSTGPGSMIKGFDEAVRMLKPGGSAKVFIPSMLAYGGNPNSPLIKPYEHLTFDIQVVEVKDKMPEQPEMKMPRPQPGQKVDMPQPK